MTFWQEGLIALLATIGLAAIIWLPIRSVCFLPGIKRRLTAIFCVQGDCTELDREVSALVLLRRECGIQGSILLLDCGLSDEGRRICRLLTKLHPTVILCDRDDAESLITQGEAP